MNQASVQHLVLFDGACGLCSRLVRFVLPRPTFANASST